MHLSWPFLEANGNRPFEGSKRTRVRRGETKERNLDVRANEKKTKKQRLDSRLLKQENLQNFASKKHE